MENSTSEMIFRLASTKWDTAAWYWSLFNMRLFKCVIQCKHFAGVENVRFPLFLQLFWDYLREFLSHILDTFEAEGIQPQMFQIEWFTTVYAKDLSQNIAARVWDLYFYYGPIILYKSGI